MNPKIYFLFGEETYLLKRFIDNLRFSFPEAEFITKEAQNITEKELINLCSSLPFFNVKQILHLPGILENPQLDPDSKILQQILTNLPKHTFLIFSHNGSPDKRKKMFKVLFKHCASKEFTPISGFQLKTWLENEFKKNQGSITPSALTFLQSFVGNNLWQLEKEIKKLCLYCQKTVITEKEIENIVIASKEAIVFDFVDCLGEKKTPKALELLHSLVQDRYEATMMLGMIVRQIRLILQCLSLKKSFGCNWKKYIKLEPFVAQKIERQSKHFTQENLKQIYQRLYDFDKTIKTTSKFNSLCGLDFLTIELTQ